jgi:hypothetical protein
MNSSMIFDLHQTTTSCVVPFLLIKNATYNYHFLNIFNWPELPVIIYNENVCFSKDGESLSSFAHKKKIPFMTLELGEQGINHQYIERAFQSLKVFLTSVINLQIPLNHSSHPKNFLYIESDVLLKENNEHVLVKGIGNMTSLKSGDPLHLLNNKTHYVHEDALAMFPKYGEMQRISSELVRLVTPITFHQLTLK